MHVTELFPGRRNHTNEDSESDPLTEKNAQDTGADERGQLAKSGISNSKTSKTPQTDTQLTKPNDFSSDRHLLLASCLLPKLSARCILHPAMLFPALPWHLWDWRSTIVGRTELVNDEKDPMSCNGGV